MPLAYPYCYYQNCNTPELRWVFIAIAAVVTVAAVASTIAVRVQRRRNRRNWP